MIFLTEERRLITLTKAEVPIIPVSGVTLITLRTYS